MPQHHRHQRHHRHHRHQRHQRYQRIPKRQKMFLLQRQLPQQQIQNSQQTRMPKIDIAQPPLVWYSGHYTRPSWDYVR
ncbi:hypothetical protein BV898_14077 [Hypsibius exemplaris]|uniref:Uncharacterized protein n=1 Tax=Hypsibius exemplaris TaxID=2072580 RepID=A0A1W0W8X9_HYPEX|nr:hypothetical protein BV898_14077 [Hypsibius exemplaris]